MTAHRTDEPSGPEALRGMQQDFKRYLFDDDPAMVERVADTPGADRGESTPGNGEPLTPEVRLSIYHNAYFSRLIETLENDYPVLCHLLGGERFQGLADAYIRHHPSTSFSLRWLGDGLADFMAQQGDWLSDPHWFETAQLEWCFVDAFDSGGEQRASVEDAAAMAPEAWPGMTLAFHGSVQMVELEWNVLPRWQAVTRQLEGSAIQGAAPVDASVDAPTASKGGADRADIPSLAALSPREPVVIWRNGIDTCYRPMQADEVAIFRLARQGGDFSGFCERISQWHAPEAIPMRAATVLKKWLGDGMIAHLGEQNS